jgi:hypothetical protein
MQIWLGPQAERGNKQPVHIMLLSQEPLWKYKMKEMKDQPKLNTLQHGVRTNEGNKQAAMGHTCRLLKLQQLLENVLNFAV